MKMNAVFVAVLLLAGLAFADVVPSAFTVSPTTFKAGVSGTLSFTLTNTGNRTLTGVDLYGNGQSLTFLTDKTSIGALGPGASTVVSIPFRVADNARAGVYNIQISAYFVDVDGQGYKTFSYPLTVSSLINFQVSALNVSGAVSPGQQFTLDTVVEATGGEAKNVRLSSASTQFTLSGYSEVRLGDMVNGAEAPASIALVAASGITPGVYSVPLTVTYEDGLGATQTTTMSVGPITVFKRSIFFSVSTAANAERVNPGERVSVMVSITNVGNEEAKFVRVALYPNATGFVLLNAGEQYLASIPAGESRNVSFEMGVNAGITPGFYPLRLVIGFSDVHGVEQQALAQSLGLDVTGEPGLDVIAGASPSPITAGKKYSLSLQVANIGTYALKSVRVSVSGSQFDLLVSPNAYIGSLNVDDYSTVTYPVYLHDDVPAGRQEFDVAITYRDSANVQRTVNKKAYLEVLSAEAATKAYANGGGSNSVVLLGGIAVLAVVAYFGYKRFFGQKKRS